MKHVWDRVIFLTRRDQVARAVSDLLGQQTELWGPLTSDGRLDPDADEVSTYRAEVRRRRLEPPDPAVIEWYLREVPALEEQHRAEIDDARRLDVTYESIFDERVSLPERVLAYRALLDFLGYDSSPRHWDRAAVEHVLAPTRRLNGLAAERSIEGLEAAQRELQSQRDSLLLSRTWRWSAPLRRIAAWVMGVR